MAQVVVHALLQRAAAWLSPKKVVMLSALRETSEEVRVMEDVLEAYRSGSGWVGGLRGEEGRLFWARECSCFDISI